MVAATKNKRLCFLIGPIGAHNSRIRKHADALLRTIVHPTFRTHFRDFKVERADHIPRPGMIDSQIITYLIEADLVVCDLAGRNANAFYELGIRHMLQKPIIHLFKRGDTIPATSRHTALSNFPLRHPSTFVPRRHSYGGPSLVH